MSSSSSNNLKLIVEKLAAPPFSKTLSIIQIHDELTFSDLLRCTFDVLAYIDEADTYSIFKNFDARIDISSVIIESISDFLHMLKFKHEL